MAIFYHKSIDFLKNKCIFQMENSAGRISGDCLC